MLYFSIKVQKNPIIWSCNCKKVYNYAIVPFYIYDGTVARLQKLNIIFYLFSSKASSSFSLNLSLTHFSLSLSLSLSPSLSHLISASQPLSLSLSLSSYPLYLSLSILPYS